MRQTSHIRSKLIQWMCSRRGNVAIITALLAPALVGFAGMGAETGLWYFRQRDIQAAADIAAYNATVALRGGASVGVIDTGATTDASQNGWRAAQGTIAINTPPQSGPNQNNRSVEVLLTENQKRYFTALFFKDTLPIDVRAVATYQAGKPACMLGLNKSQSNTVQFWGNAYADFKACNIVSNSIANNAFSLGGSAQVIVPCVNTVGGASVSADLTLTDCNSVTTHAAYVPDPYAGVPTPQAGSCQSGPTGGVLTPGTYCGLTLQNTVTVQPGLYVISGGNFKVNAGANITGTDVTFFLTGGATLQFNGNANLNLTAPTTGPYKGILFYGDRTQPNNTNTLNGSASSQFTGVVYFPSQRIEILGNFSGANGCMQVVADTIYYTGSATFTTNCVNSGMATIPVPGNVALVE